MGFDRGNPEMERETKVVVLDASVVVKWFVDEEGTESAIDIRQDYLDGRVDIRSSELMPFEVMNALRYNREFGHNDLCRCISALLKYQLKLYPLSEELGAMTVNNALNFGITVYDAAYVSISQLIGAVLYTADERLLSKLEGLENTANLSAYR